MEYQIIILTFVSIFFYSSAILSEKPDGIEVTKENQEEFALPVGTILFLDKGTQLYIPPPLASNFTAKDRMKVQWFNKKTRYNYCKVGPDINSWKMWFKYMLYNWCRDKDGEDMCCGDKKCSCNLVQANCGCVSPKLYNFYETKKDQDLDKYLHFADEAADKIFETTPKPAGPAKEEAKDKTPSESTATDDKAPSETNETG